MARGVCWYLVGSIVLGVLGLLAGCSGGGWFVERESWRHEAEAQCINSGAVKEGVAVVRVKPIAGPGMCGADFPLKVSALGVSGALGYGDEPRPPDSIPNASPAQPRWPVGEPRPLPPPQEALPTYGAPNGRPVAPPQRSAAPVSPRYEPLPPPGAPLVLSPPGSSGPAEVDAPYDFRRPYGVQPAARPPVTSAPIGRAPLDPYEYRPNASAPESRPPYNAPIMRHPSQDGARSHTEPPLVPLGPARGRAATASASVAVSPAATLACPLVSALDQWIASAVQPAAMRWFNQPVVEIRQISAYSCRGMNGNPNARISEHAFGNALDIAAFTLADGRKVTVKGGWRGLPEEQGFLRDVQGAACERFSTVLAPGSNAFHYDHIHVDLMRRSNGRRACNPHAMSGEEVAARARAVYAARRGGEPAVTGSIALRRLPPPPKRLPPTAYSDEKPDRELPPAMPGNDGED